MKALTTLIISLLLIGCASVDRGANLQLGMTRAEVISAMGKNPAAIHNRDGIERLEFDYAHPVKIGENWTAIHRKFPVYLRDGRAFAWGDDDHRADYTMEHRFTGGTTNEYVRSTR